MTMWADLRAAMRQNGGDVIVSVGGKTVTIRNADLAGMDAGDFIGVASGSNSAPVIVNTGGSLTVVAIGIVPQPVLTNDNGTIAATG